MWRATVIEVRAPGWVVVTIPKLYRNDPVGPMQAAMIVNVGEAVVVADLTPNAKTRDWWVMARESEIGLGPDSPAFAHTHSIGDIDGLADELASKATTTDLDGYTTDAELTTALSTRAALAGDWAEVPTSVMTADTSTARGLSIRATAYSVQLSGRVRLTAAIALDQVVATVPAGYAPPFPMIMNVATMGPGPSYSALAYSFELHENRTITARQSMASGARLTFNQTLIY